MIFLILFVVVLILYALRNYVRLLNYWKDRGVKKSVTPLPFIGNLLQPILKTMSLAEYVASLYNAYPKERYCGVFQFGTPVLLIRDPELVKTIIVKEFNSFINHGSFKEDIDPMWGKNLFASEGTKWRNLRHTLSPVFTSKKMKFMYVLMEDCTNKLVEHLNDTNEEIVEVELQSLMKRFAMDVIATTAFGIETNSLKHADNEFLKFGSQLTDFTGFRRFSFLLYNINPTVAKILNLKVVNDDVSDFFYSIIKHTLHTRTKENIVRPDFIHLILEAKKGNLHIDELIGSSDHNSKSINNQKEFAMNLTDEDIAAQAVIFILGGYDTTTRLITFCLYELAASPEIQQKLRDNVDENLQKFGGKISYEDLFQMKYLDMVISETLRKWPPGLYIDRRAGSSFTIQPEREDENPVHLQTDDICWIPIFAIQRDPKYWPNPDTFDPERFSDKNKEKLVPGTYLPFGLGPRNCIGSRYSIMKAKLVIFHLLANFEVVPTERSRIPLELSKNDILLTPLHNFWFGLKKRRNLKKTE